MVEKISDIALKKTYLTSTNYYILGYPNAFLLHKDKTVRGVNLSRRCGTVCVCVSSVSVEDRGVGSLDDLSLSEQSYPPQDAGLRYSTLVSGELNRDSKKCTPISPPTHPPSSM